MTFDGMSDDNRRRLMIVTAISLGMFIIEALAGQLAGSQSLKADALDFVAHGITYALAFWAIGRSMPARLAAAIVKAGSLVAMGLWVAATTLYHFFVPAPPDAGIMAFIGLVGLGANAITLGTLFVQRGEGGELFLISLKAGGTGLTLTAADYVVHLDPWWNPAVEDQASDRAHRIGQDKPVTVYRLIAQGTIEEQILSLHREKRELVDSFLSGADAAGKLSTPQLAALIRGE